MAIEINALRLTLRECNEIAKVELDVEGDASREDIEEVCELLDHPYSREIAIGRARSTTVGSCICGGRIYRPMTRVPPSSSNGNGSPPPGPPWEVVL